MGLVLTGKPLVVTKRGLALAAFDDSATEIGRHARGLLFVDVRQKGSSWEIRSSQRVALEDNTDRVALASLYPEVADLYRKTFARVRAGGKLPMVVEQRTKMVVEQRTNYAQAVMGAAIAAATYVARAAPYVAQAAPYVAQAGRAGLSAGLAVARTSGGAIDTLLDAGIGLFRRKKKNPRRR